MEIFDRGAYHPSRRNQWAAFSLDGDPCDIGTIVWFPERSLAVDYAKSRGWKAYAIARAWGIE